MTGDHFKFCSKDHWRVNTDHPHSYFGLIQYSSDTFTAFYLPRCVIEAIVFNTTVVSPFVRVADADTVVLQLKKPA